MRSATHINNLVPAKERTDPYQRLAFAVLINALRDVTQKKSIRALDATLWLARDGLIFMEALGLESDPMEWLTEGAKMTKGKGVRDL